METTALPTSRLVVCPDCGGGVSRAAAACPHCGFTYRPAPKPVTVGTIAWGVFCGLVLWSLIPLAIAIFFFAVVGAALSGPG